MKSLEEWKAIWQQTQLDMQNSLQILSDEEDFFPDHGSMICTMDVQYEDELAYVAMDVMYWPDQPYRIFLYREKVKAPYVPGYFSFREGPILQQALRALKDYLGRKPDILIIDGHGTAHPRKMGIASWIGIKEDIKSMGVAKDPLLKQDYSMPDEEGSQCEVFWGNDCVGYALRTQVGVKPIYVSAGHLMSQDISREIAWRLRGQYRIIDPIRRADWAARAFSKKESSPKHIFLDI
ncbi:MAG: endonuclease V [Bacteroidota bacterium]